MRLVFYLSGLSAIFCTFMVITRVNAVHALLYLILSLFSVALMFFVLGAPFAAALEIIVYAGAIMVLFVFVCMMLNIGPKTTGQERAWLTPGIWKGPSVLAAALVGQIVYLLVRSEPQLTAASQIGPKRVGIALFGPYLLGVELASFLLLAALVAAYHLGRRIRSADAEHGGAS